MIFDIEKTFVPGLLIIRNKIFKDERGYFEEIWRNSIASICGVAGFVQDNHSKSSRNVLRGLHFQLRNPQIKLVSVISGSIYDVGLDLRKGSPTFGKWFGLRMDSESGIRLLIPAGVAHGFCVLSENADVIYKCSDYYDPSDDRGVIWNDPDAKIEWPINNPVVSLKDSKLPRLADIQPDDLPQWMGE